MSNMDFRNNTDIFLDKYRQLETMIRNSFELDVDEEKSPVKFLLRQAGFQNIRAELDYCREVRNLLAHKSVDSRYAIEPNDNLIRLLEEAIRKIQNPPLAKHIAVRRENILCKTMSDLVLETMIEMHERDYSHVPILEHDIICGVFSENTILAYMVDQKKGFDEHTRMSDIRQYLPLDVQRSETYHFVAWNTPVNEMVRLFEKARDSSERVGMIFITEHGKKDEKLKGLVTAQDVAAV